MKQYPIIDLHQDIATNALYATGKDIGKRYSLHEGTVQVPGIAVNNNADIPRYREGNLKLVFGVVFSLDKESVDELNALQQTEYDFSKMNGLKYGLSGAVEQLAYYHDVLHAYSNDLQLVRSRADYEDLGGKIGVLLHLEGIDYIADLSLLESFYKMGVRSVAMTWRNKNVFASGNNVEGGLTDLGRELIGKTRELGMVFDLAHANPQTFWDAMEAIDFPFMVSHTLVNRIKENSRNLTDDQIKAVAERGGVVGIATIPDYMSGDTMDDYVDQFDYIVKLVGEDHVVFGTDFDGLVDPTDRFVQGFEDASMYQNVLQAFDKRGFSETAIEKIAYKNAERLIMASLS